MFHWDADRAPDILTTYAWIYPAVAGPLTILVLSLWFGWIKVSFIFDRLQLRTSDGAPEKSTHGSASRLWRGLGPDADEDDPKFHA